MAPSVQSTRSKVLFDLLESTIEARAHWQTWWALVSVAKPKYVARMNHFSDFFQISEHAHFNSVFINLAHLFDKRRDVSSVERYLGLAKDLYPAGERQELRSRLSVHAAALAGVLEIRNNLIAHKNAGQNEKEIFAKAGVTPDQIAALLNETVALINLFAKREGWDNRIPSSNRYSNATLGILDSLTTP
jgi:hypothetical protein